jgi:hypothetical protein
MDNDETCQADASIANGICTNTATEHVSWPLDNGGRRDKHYCGIHAAELIEGRETVQVWPISSCGATCPIIIDRAARQSS